MRKRRLVFSLFEFGWARELISSSTVVAGGTSSEPPCPFARVESTRVFGRLKANRRAIFWRSEQGSPRSPYRSLGSSSPKSRSARARTTRCILRFVVHCAPEASLVARSVRLVAEAVERGRTEGEAMEGQATEQHEDTEEAQHEEAQQAEAQDAEAIAREAKEAEEAAEAQAWIEERESGAKEGNTADAFELGRTYELGGVLHKVRR